MRKTMASAFSLALAAALGGTMVRVEAQQKPKAQEFMENPVQDKKDDMKSPDATTQKQSTQSQAAAPKPRQDCRDWKVPSP